MTTATDLARKTSRSRSALRFTLHYVEMVVAMVVGMIVLGPLWPDLPGGATVDVLVMATNMSVGMAAWMRIRKHGWAGIAWMCASMYAAFALVLPPYWIGLIDAGTMMTAGHILMLPLMLAVMLRRH
jgi:flagellar biosynthetic protein FliP